METSNSLTRRIILLVDDVEDGVDIWMGQADEDFDFCEGLHGCILGLEDSLAGDLKPRGTLV